MNKRSVKRVKLDWVLRECEIVIECEIRVVIECVLHSRVAS